MGDKPHRVLYFWHTVVNYGLTFISNMFSDLNLTDMETCYKVFKKEVLKKIIIEEDRFGIEPELTAKIGELFRTENLKVYEVGISYSGRTYQEGKKIKAKDAVHALYCILKYNSSRIANLVKYVINGLIVALSQYLTIYLLVEWFNFRSELYQNIANFIAIMVSITIAFVLHSKITWMYKFQSNWDFIKKMFLFYLITSITVIMRIYLYDFLYNYGLNYQLNTIIGIVVIIVINFFGYDKLFQKTLRNRNMDNLDQQYNQGDIDALSNSSQVSI
jgi:putative flippase GtrA